MNISLKRATYADCPLIHSIQIKAFAQLLQKYQDFDSSPAAESLEQIQKRFDQPFTDYYLILLGDEVVGMLRVCDFGINCRLSPICVLPEYRARGIARKAILSAEKLYPEAIAWQLDTIMQEGYLCRFYESLGYVPTGKIDSLKEGMDLIFYEKRMC